MNITQQQIEELVEQGRFDELQVLMRTALDEAFIGNTSLPDAKTVALKAQMAIEKELLEVESKSHQEAIATTGELDDLLQIAGDQDALAQARSSLQ
jgi:hypothetical protein